MNHHAMFAVLALVASASASAGQAEICYSASVPFASAVPPTNATVFACPVSGAKTMPELAALGWEVVQLTPISTNGGANITDQLVIQKK